VVDLLWTAGLAGGGYAFNQGANAISECGDAQRPCSQRIVPYLPAVLAAISAIYGAATLHSCRTQLSSGYLGPAAEDTGPNE
jgi:hypothetical protein